MRKAKWILLVFVALLIVTAIAFASDLLPHPNDLIRFYARSAETDPAEAIPGPIVRTSGNTTMALVNAVASSSQTVVEFVVEDVSFPEDLEAMRNISIGPGPLPGEELHLSGFAEEAVLSRRTTRGPGRIHLVWELPPPAAAGEPVAIEIEALPINRINQETGQMTSDGLSGPWRFEFTPLPAQEQQPIRQFTVKQMKMSGPVAVTVEDVLLSETETVVSVRYEGPPDIHWLQLGTPVLRHNGASFDGRQKQANEAGGSDQAWHFPALPAEASSFVVAFNPLWLSVEDKVEITLDLNRLQAEEQVVELGEYNFAFALAPSVESAGFMITYRPANTASNHFLLGVQGAQPTIVDDLGNEYTLAGGNTDFDPDEGFALEQQAFYTHEPLVEEATELTLHFEQTGRITNPVQFEVEIPNP